MNIRSVNIGELADRCRSWIETEIRTQSVDEIVLQLERFEHEFDALSHDFLSCAAWCRLAVGRLRGEDVPKSIHPAEDEDPADTIRWRHWRVS